MDALWPRFLVSEVSLVLWRETAADSDRLWLDATGATRYAKPADG